MNLKTKYTHFLIEKGGARREWTILCSLLRPTDAERSAKADELRREHKRDIMVWSTDSDANAIKKHLSKRKKDGADDPVANNVLHGRQPFVKTSWLR
jgi:hypothetical protein